MGLKELRVRASSTRDLQEVRVKRIRDAVVDVVNSSSFVLSAAEHANEDVNKLAETVATKVTQVVTDYKQEFHDTCIARGLKTTDIRRAVKLINETFGLTTAVEYDEQLESVSEFMHNNPSMYDDIAVLKR